MTRRCFAAALTVLAIAGSLFAGDDKQSPPPLDRLLSTPVSTANQCEHVLSSTAAKYEQALGSVPASITIITAEEIERYGWTTLDQVLQSVPGFYLTNDRNYTYVGVRGIGRPTDYNTRILVLLDGHQLNEPVIGEAPGGADLAVDLRTVSKIEIVRGPGSALYGSHAMHAVINIITQSADEMDGLSATGRAASHGDETGALRFGKTFGNGVQATASALWREANGANHRYPEYASDANGDVARRRDYENLYGLAFALRRGNFNLSASRRSRTKGIPTGSYESLFDVDSWTTNWSDMIAADYHRNLGANKTLELSASWDRSGEHGVWPYDAGAGVDNTFAVRLTGEGRLYWDLRPNQRLTMGVEWMKIPSARYKFVLGDYETRFSVPYDMTSYYAEYEYRPWSWLGLVGGIRRDDFSATADSTNPRAAILLTPTRSATLKLLYGTAFRSPNVYEAFYADPVTPWKANPQLRPERVRTAEIELEQRLSPELFLVASAFHIAAADMIDQQVDPSDDINWYQNIGRLHSAGAEVKLDLRRNEGVWGYLSYSLASARDALGPISNSPRHLVKAGLSTTPWKPIHLGLDAVYESARLTRDGQRSDSFLLLNGTLSRQLGEYFRLGITGRNLLDKRYATPVGPELRQQSIRQDGRTLALEITYSR
jgi:outer membrane receptor for ferrienterochelin and colicins